MTFKLSAEETKKLLAAKSQYIAQMTRIMASPQPYSFDSVVLYFRECEKLAAVSYEILEAHQSEILMMAASGMIAGEITQELRIEIDSILNDNDVKNLENRYLNNESRITGYNFYNNPKKLEKASLSQVFKGEVKKNYEVKFSDGDALVWHSLSDTSERARARSEFDHKMEALANQGRAENEKRFIFF